MLLPLVYLSVLCFVIVFALTHSLGVALQENRLNRVASYRQLQAVSHQIHLLTKGRFRDLDAFSVPDGINLGPMKRWETRLVRKEHGNRSRAYHRNTQTGEDVALLPLDRRWWVPVPLLVLQFDQGPACCAASAPLGLNGVAWCKVFWARLKMMFFRSFPKQSFRKIFAICSE